MLIVVWAGGFVTMEKYDFLREVCFYFFLLLSFIVTNFTFRLIQIMFMLMFSLFQLSVQTIVAPNWGDFQIITI